MALADPLPTLPCAPGIAVAEGFGARAEPAGLGMTAGSFSC